MRRTEQRSAILTEIRNRKDHPTAYDLYHVIKESLPNISLGTVYRNLEFLSREGIIRKIDYGDDQKRFDADTSDHPHFRCAGCGRVEDVPADPLPEFNGAMKDYLRQRPIFAVNLEFVGLCPVCAEKQALK